MRYGNIVILLSGRGGGLSTTHPPSHSPPSPLSLILLPLPSFPNSCPPPPDMRPYHLLPTTDIWWSRLETCSLVRTSSGCHRLGSIYHTGMLSCSLVFEHQTVTTLLFCNTMTHTCDIFAQRTVKHHIYFTKLLVILLIMLTNALLLFQLITLTNVTVSLWSSGYDTGPDSKRLGFGLLLRH